MKCCLFILTLTAFATGCAVQRGNYEPAADRKDFVQVDQNADGAFAALTDNGKPDGEDAIEPFEVLPHSELASAVIRGEARSAGPITEARYRRWHTAADLQVRLEGQLGKQSHFQDLLKLAESSEDEFTRRFGIRGAYPGESVDSQLRMFQIVRKRLEAEIVKTNQEIEALRLQIQKLHEQETWNQPPGGRTMSKSVSSFGLSAGQVAKLHAMGIYDARQFTLQFYLPAQRPLLTQLLGLDLPACEELVRSMAREVPADELEALVREAQKPREFGVLPPDANQP